MTNIWIGMAAGFAATLLLSAMMLMKDAMKFMPQMDMIGMISGMMKMSRAMGWLIHFIVGTALYGFAYAFLFAPLWPGAYWLSGMALGVVGWLLASLAMMPMADKGFFGMKMGAIAPMMSLVMHVFFGAVLGWVYGLLIGGSPGAAP
jgi:hypothetical protein